VYRCLVNDEWLFLLHIAGKRNQQMNARTNEKQKGRVTERTKEKNRRKRKKERTNICMSEENVERKR
jgi:hypothetical protein